MDRLLQTGKFWMTLKENTQVFCRFMNNKMIKSFLGPSGPDGQ